MRVVLTGGTGYIGRHLVRALAARGDECVVISRSARNPWDDPRVRVVRGDPTAAGPWQREVSGAHAVVNLAGERIGGPLVRWTARRKASIRSSRVDTTRQIVAAIRAAAERPRALLSGSAIGYYGPRGDESVDESAQPGTDFLGQLAGAWEAAAQEGEDLTRVALLRSGIVLGSNSPALAPLVPLFKLGLGGSWGDGKQWWSWIHIADEVGLILHILDRALSGPFNLTAPNPVRVEEFAKALGRALHRPAVLRAPALAPRLALGEAADALLHLQRVVPKRALETGYAFRFPTLDEALGDVF